MHVLASISTFLLSLLWCRIEKLPSGTRYYLQTDTDVRYEKSYSYRHLSSCMKEAVG